MYDDLYNIGKALSSESIYYFFNKVTENRATKSGYWKELHIDKPVLTSAGNKVGFKKYLLFFIGDAPAGFETAWMMEEYHLCNYGVSATFSFFFFFLMTGIPPRQSHYRPYWANFRPVQVVVCELQLKGFEANRNTTKWKIRRKYK
jgi:hypothetical protein